MATTTMELDTIALEAQVRGELIRPGDDGYDDARAIYNAMIDRRPALVVRAADVADVIAVVNFARENGAELAIRCGGHNVAGFGVADDGIVLDLSPMKGIRVDPDARLVTAQGGCTWGDIDHATHAFGLATPGGVVSTTGMGLTLGGGLGHLTRSYGLTIDNLVSADFVLADGSFVTASEDQNEDLFWAIRGGGGNFGVATSFTFRLHPVHMDIAGPMLWPIDQAADAMRMYRDVMANAPDRLTGVFAFIVVPPGPPFPEEFHLKTMCGIVWCHTGTAEEAEADLAPARAFSPSPAFDHIGPIPHPILQSLFDGIAFAGMHNYWRGDFFDELSEDAIATFVEHGSKVPNPFSSMHLYPVDGVAARVGKDETPWSYRDAKWSQVIFAADSDPSKADDLKSWVIGYWEATHPYSMGGSYVNFISDEGQERVRTAYRENYDRLAESKKRFDPTNLFHLNQNIGPAS